MNMFRIEIQAEELGFCFQQVGGSRADAIKTVLDYMTKRNPEVLKRKFFRIEATNLDVKG